MLIGPEDFVIAEVGTIDRGPLLSGSLEPRARAELVAQASGSVEAVTVELGDRVEAGELLVRIEGRELQNAVASARTALASAQQAYEVARRQRERTRALIASGALAENDAELAENELAAARARRDQARSSLASARRQLQGARVRAPFDGVVSERSVSRGDVVTLGAPLLTLIDPSSMRLEASVPSEALPMLADGLGVEFRVRGLGDQVFRGSIERVGPAADPLTRQIPLLVTVPNPSGRLAAGLFAEGHVAVQVEQGLVLPTTALDVEAGNPVVHRLAGDRVEVVGVAVGVRDPSSERVQITSGLQPGDRVLTGAAKTLRDGTWVELRPPITG